MKWKTFEGYIRIWEFQDDVVLRAVRRVVERIPEDTHFPLFDVKEMPIREGACVTEDRELWLDSRRLRRLHPDSLVGILAHELAHLSLEHYARTATVAQCFEADRQAFMWGFEEETRRMRAPEAVSKYVK